ncbi:hypothetical protein [Lacticaseibacillus pantheris]|jgi:hypothetical protein
MKFCPECGHELETPNPKFCPNCGTSVTNSATANADQPIAASQGYNAETPVPPAMGNSMYRDLKEGRIKEYKKAIGLPATIDNVIYGQIQHLASALVGPIATIATNKNVLVDFEDDGVFIFGLNVACNFNGKNVWAPGAKIEMSSGMLNNSLVVEANGERIKYTVSKRLLGIPWQKENAKAALAKFS